LIERFKEKNVNILLMVVRENQWNILEDWRLFHQLGQQCDTLNGLISRKVLSNQSVLEHAVLELLRTVGK